MSHAFAGTDAKDFRILVTIQDAARLYHPGRLHRPVPGAVEVTSWTLLRASLFRRDDQKRTLPSVSRRRQAAIRPRSSCPGYHGLIVHPAKGPRQVCSRKLLLGGGDGQGQIDAAVADLRQVTSFSGPYWCRRPNRWCWRCPHLSPASWVISRCPGGVSSLAQEWSPVPGRQRHNPTSITSLRGSGHESRRIRAGIRNRLWGGFWGLGVRWHGLARIRGRWTWRAHGARVTRQLGRANIEVLLHRSDTRNVLGHLLGFLAVLLAGYRASQLHPSIVRRNSHAGEGRVVRKLLLHVSDEGNVRHLRSLLRRRLGCGTGYLATDWPLGHARIVLIWGLHLRCGNPSSPA